MLKINFKEKRTVGKANKGINVEKIKVNGNNKRKTPQTCKSPMWRQRFKATIENVSEEKKRSKA